VKRSVTAFVLAFAACAAAIHALLPAPPTLYDAKLAWLAAHAGDYDTIFIGSSFVHNQLVPRELDDEMAARGHPTRSFNFGLPGMSCGEALYVLEHVLALHPAHLKRLVLDGDMNDRPEHEDVLTRRTIGWHAPEPTAISMAAMWRAPETLAYRTAAIRQDALGALQRLFDVGVINEWLSGARDSTDVGAEGYATRDSWQDLDPTRPAGAKYRAAVDELRDHGRAPAEASGYRETLFEAMVARGRARGLEPLVLLAPTLHRYPPPSVRVPVYAFNDPSRQPELYDRLARADINHLNDRGARLYSRAVARALAAALDAVH
jgi:hypothetical protein